MTINVTNTGLPAPTGVIATAATATSVTVSWTTITGASGYVVYRSTGGASTVVGNPMTSPFTDISASANTAYLYTVRAVDPRNGEGAESAPDLATTVIFSDDPIVAQSTIVRAAHFGQLRVAVNAVRALAGLTAASFTDASLAGLPIKKVPIDQLRAALDPARSSLLLSAVAYRSDDRRE